MTQINRDNPCYFLTSVALHRLPIFQADRIKQILCNAWNEARRSGSIKIFAYVIMPDHIHIITDGRRGISDVLRFTNGVSAKRILDFLKENNYQTSLKKLQLGEKDRGYKYSLWQDNPDAFRITGEDIFMQKVDYIHQNPVRAGLAENAGDYIFSSARLWSGHPSENGPFITDHDKIEWRKRSKSSQQDAAA